jgi:small GTP-binding protein
MAEVKDSGSDRTRKREPGKITRAIKVALVGDGTVGKTCMLMSYVCQAFMEDYIPTMFDNFSAIEEVDGELVNVILWDTAGQEDYETIRTTTCFPNTHMFILCFSVVHPDSFHNIKQKWLPELQKSCPDTPFILVGTKADLRNDEETIRKLQEKSREPISEKMGKKKAKEIKARLYLECTAREVDSVNQIFRQALKIVMDPLKERKKQVAKLAKKEEIEEKKMEEKVAKAKKKLEEKEGKQKTKEDGKNGKQEA